MYEPKDKYIQKQIKQASRILRDVLDESTNKEETQHDIIDELKKVLPIQEDGEIWF